MGDVVGDRLGGSEVDADRAPPRPFLRDADGGSVKILVKVLDLEPAACGKAGTGIKVEFEDRPVAGVEDGVACGQAHELPRGSRERARVSSRGSAVSRPRNWAWAGLGTVIGNRSSAAAAWRYLKKLERDAIRQLRVFRGSAFGDQVVAPAVDFGDGGPKQGRRVARPGDLAEGDEGHDVLAVSPLGVPARPAGNPRFEYLGDREVETSDPFLDPARRAAGEDRRQFPDESFGEHDQLPRTSRSSPDHPDLHPSSPAITLIATMHDNRFYHAPSSSACGGELIVQTKGWGQALNGVGYEGCNAETQDVMINRVILSR